MKSRTPLAAGALLLIALAAGAGYLFGTRHSAPLAPADGASTTVRKPLYYRNPMGLADTSPVPKKDPMGMDYIAVYAGEEAGAKDAAAAVPGQITLSTEKIQKLGVRLEAASTRPITKVVRAAGRIEADERRTFTVAPKFEGYVERLHVNATGQAIAKGQPLFEAYSPELVSAQREYAIAAQGVQALKASGSEAHAGMQQLADASLQRLKNWDISDEQVRALARSGQARRTLTLRSPASGIVTEKKAVQGMRFMPGDALFQIADLSSVWVIADVFEQDIGLVKPGAKASVKIDAYPDKVFTGTLAYVYPILKNETRTMQVRIELPNRGLLLKPGMYAQVELATPARAQAVTVPLSAIIDSGTRRIVLVASGEGRFAPREVTVGARSDDYAEILQGVRDGEQVVVAANFLIDAESNLKAALGGFGAAAKPAAPGTPTAAPAAAAAPTAARTGGAHIADGKVVALDAKAGTVSIAHGPVASLEWPAMTMEFKLANPALAATLAPGKAVHFEFVERQPGEWVLTTASTPAQAPAAHAGH